MMKINSKSLNALHDTAGFLYNIMRKTASIFPNKYDLTYMISFDSQCNTAKIYGFLTWVSQWLPLDEAAESQITGVCLRWFFPSVPPHTPLKNNKNSTFKISYFKDTCISNKTL